jgi:glycosyltransferase involved in cell wall biosynthesis
LSGEAPSLDILYIEPFDGGSHRDFRTGLRRHSRHRFTEHTLPGRFWKWRMRGSAVWFADRINAAPPAADLIVTTGFVNVADLRGLLAPPLDRVPVLLYMHENQLTYPLSPHEEFDYHFGFTSILSCLAADRVVFNSDWHREIFLDEVPGFLGRLPEAVPRRAAERIARKSAVIGVGLEREPLPADHFPLYRGGRADAGVGGPWPRGERPRLLWNHRWEFDKRPDQFTAAVTALLDRGLDFEVALAGDSRGGEDVFAELRERLGARCVAYGYQDSRADYDRLLEQSDVVVSCAEQEYFGIAVAEAVHAGCYPVLPRRQVYPSLYGSNCRGRHFYDDTAGLIALLSALITGDECGHVCSLDRDVDPYCWPRLAPVLDDELAAAAAAGRRPDTAPEAP